MIGDALGLAMFSFPGIHQGINLAFALLEVVRLGLTPETASSAAYIAVQLIGAGVIGGLVVPRLVGCRGRVAPALSSVAVARVYGRGGWVGGVAVYRNAGAKRWRLARRLGGIPSLPIRG